MSSKGEYPRHYAVSAQAALEVFVRRVAEETGIPESKINPQVAKRLGVSAPLVSKMRTGKQKMQLPVVLRLAELLGCTPNDILMRAGNTSAAAPKAASAIRTKQG